MSTSKSTSAVDALYSTHVKLLAADLLKLTPSPTDSSAFLREGKRLSRAETVGTVVTHDLKPGKFVKFAVDDGTGCISCVLWTNQLNSAYFSRHDPSGVRLIAQAAMDFSLLAQLGALVRVRGRITGYRGTVQITVTDVVAERDPNMQILHWLDCVRLRSGIETANCRSFYGQQSRFHFHSLIQANKHTLSFILSHACLGFVNPRYGNNIVLYEIYTRILRDSGLIVAVFDYNLLGIPLHVLVLLLWEKVNFKIYGDI